MNVFIPIPQWMINLWIAFGDHVNVPVWRFGQYEVLRIDLLLVIMFLFCTAFYWALYDLRSAVGAGLSFVIIAALCIFMRRPDTPS